MPKEYVYEDLIPEKYRQPKWELDYQKKLEEEAAARQSKADKARNAQGFGSRLSNTIDAGGMRMAQGFALTGELIAALAEQAVRPLPGTWANKIPGSVKEGMSILADDLGEQAEEAKMRQPDYIREDLVGGDVDRTIGQTVGKVGHDALGMIIEQVPQFAAGGFVGKLAKAKGALNPKVIRAAANAIGLSGAATEAGGALHEARKEGMDDAEATARAGVFFVASYLLNRVGAEGWLNGMKAGTKKKVLSTIIGGLWEGSTEAAEEVAQRATMDTEDAYAAYKKGDWAYFQQLGVDMLNVGIPAAAVGGLLGGILQIRKDKKFVKNLDDLRKKGIPAEYADAALTAMENGDERGYIKILRSVYNRQPDKVSYTPDEFLKVRAATELDPDYLQKKMDERPKAPPTLQEQLEALDDWGYVDGSEPFDMNATEKEKIDLWDPDAWARKPDVAPGSLDPFEEGPIVGEYDEDAWAESPPFQPTLRTPSDMLSNVPRDEELDVPNDNTGVTTGYSQPGSRDVFNDDDLTARVDTELGAWDEDAWARVESELAQAEEESGNANDAEPEVEDELTSYFREAGIPEMEERSRNNQLTTAERAKWMVVARGSKDLAQQRNAEQDDLQASVDFEIAQSEAAAQTEAEVAQSEPAATEQSEPIAQTAQSEPAAPEQTAEEEQRSYDPDWVRPKNLSRDFASRNRVSEESASAAAWSLERGTTAAMNEAMSPGEKAVVLDNVFTSMDRQGIESLGVDKEVMAEYGKKLSSAKTRAAKKAAQRWLAENYLSQTASQLREHLTIGNLTRTQREAWDALQAVVKPNLKAKTQKKAKVYTEEQLSGLMSVPTEGKKKKTDREILVDRINADAEQRGMDRIDDLDEDDEITAEMLSGIEDKSGTMESTLKELYGGDGYTIVDSFGEVDTEDGTQSINKIGMVFAVHHWKSGMTTYIRSSIRHEAKIRAFNRFKKNNMGLKSRPMMEQKNALERFYLEELHGILLEKWYHEEGTHYGLRGVFGLHDKTADEAEIAKREMAFRDAMSKVVESAGEANLKRVLGSQYRMLDVAVQGEEYLAHIRESRARQKYLHWKHQTIMQKVMTTLRNLFRVRHKAMLQSLTEMGGTYDDEQINALMDKALDWAVNARLSQYKRESISKLVLQSMRDSMVFSASGESFEWSRALMATYPTNMDDIGRIADAGGMRMPVVSLSEYQDVAFDDEVTLIGDKTMLNPRTRKHPSFKKLSENGDDYLSQESAQRLFDFLSANSDVKPKSADEFRRPMLGNYLYTHPSVEAVVSKRIGEDRSLEERASVVEDIFDEAGIGREERQYSQYRDIGRRRYVTYNLAANMRRRVGETAANRVGDVDVAAHSVEMDRRLDDLARKFEPHVRERYDTRGIGRFSELLADSVRARDPIAAMGEFYDTSKAPVAELRKFLEDLASSPSEYFESKDARPVKLGEFKRALVPKGADASVLRDSGVDVMEYEDDEHRRALLALSSQYRFSLTDDGFHSDTFRILSKRLPPVGSAKHMARMVERYSVKNELKDSGYGKAWELPKEGKLTREQTLDLIYENLPVVETTVLVPEEPPEPQYPYYSYSVNMPRRETLVEESEDGEEPYTATYEGSIYFIQYDEGGNTGYEQYEDYTRTVVGDEESFEFMGSTYANIAEVEEAAEEEADRLAESDNENAEPYENHNDTETYYAEYSYSNALDHNYEVHLLQIPNNPLSTKSPPSTHWEEEDVFAHIRMTRRIVQGRRALVIEEIQSDWHQKGYEFGYDDKNAGYLREIEEAKQRAAGSLQRIIEEMESRGFAMAVDGESVAVGMDGISIDSVIPGGSRLVRIGNTYFLFDEAERWLTSLDHYSGYEMRREVNDFLSLNFNASLRSALSTLYPELPFMDGIHLANQIGRLEAESQRRRSTARELRLAIDAGGDKQLLEDHQKNLNAIKVLKHKENSRVAAAPFRDDWYKLAFKYALKLAANEHKQALVWTRSDEQVRRYSEEQRRGMEEFYDKKLKLYANRLLKEYGVTTRPVQIDKPVDAWLIELPPAAVLKYRQDSMTLYSMSEDDIGMTFDKVSHKIENSGVKPDMLVSIDKNNEDIGWYGAIHQHMMNKVAYREPLLDGQLIGMREPDWPPKRYKDKGWYEKKLIYRWMHWGSREKGEQVIPKKAAWVANIQKTVNTAEYMFEDRKDPGRYSIAKRYSDGTIHWVVIDKRGKFVVTQYPVDENNTSMQVLKSVYVGKIEKKPPSMLFSMAEEGFESNSFETLQKRLPDVAPGKTMRQMLERYAHPGELRDSGYPRVWSIGDDKQSKQDVLEKMKSFAPKIDVTRNEGGLSSWYSYEIEEGEEGVAWEAVFTNFIDEEPGNRMYVGIMRDPDGYYWMDGQLYNSMDEIREELDRLVEQYERDDLNVYFPHGYTRYVYPGVMRRYEEHLFRLKDKVLSSAEPPRGHWGDPDVLFHVRTSQRSIELDGQPRLAYVIEEIQSDWLQKGYAEGYDDDVAESPDDAENTYYKVVDDLIESAIKSGIQFSGSEFSQVVTNPYARIDFETPFPVIINGNISYPYSVRNGLWYIDFRTKENWLKTMTMDEGGEWKRMVRILGADLEDAPLVVARMMHEAHYPVHKARAALLVADTEIVSRFRHAYTELMRIMDRKRKAVPAAPFRDDWHKIAFKYALKEAALKGHDVVAWSDSNEQVRRYSEKQRKGMESFYDTKLPNYAKKYLKKYGVEVKEAKIGDGRIWAIELPQNARQDLIYKPQLLYSMSEGEMGMTFDQFSAQQRAEESLSIVDVFKGLKRFRSAGKNIQELKDIGAIEQALMHPSHYGESVPAYARGREHAANRVDLRWQIEHELYMHNGVNLAKTLKEFEGDPMYDAVKAELKRVDQYVDSRTLRMNGEKWQVLSRNGRVEKSFDDEWEALEYMFEQEGEELRAKGFTQRAINFVHAVRVVNAKAFEKRMERIREYNLALSKIDSNPAKALIDGEEVDIEAEMNKMGELRGSYMPRMRDEGVWIATVKKEGHNPQLKKFDTKAVAKIWAAAWEAKGWTISGIYQNDQPAQEAILDTRIAAIEDVVNTAIARMNAKEWTLESLGFDVSRKTTSDGIPEIILRHERKIAPALREVLRDYKAQHYAIDEKDGEKVWHIKPSMLENFSEEQLSKDLALAHLDTSGVTEQFAGMFAEHIADIIKARGSQSSTIRRNPEKGLGVWEGYETDPIAAVSASTRSLAGGISKLIVGENMMRAFTGTDISFEEFAAEHGSPEKGTEQYRALRGEYHKLVDERRIHSGKQTRAWEDAMSLYRNTMRNSTRSERVFGTFRALAAIKYLSGIGTAVVNMTAIPTTLVASMKAYGGISSVKATKRITQAGYYYPAYLMRKSLGGNIWVTKALKNTLGKGVVWDVDPEWERIFDIITEKGWAQSQYNREAMTLGKSKLGSFGGAVADNLMAGVGITEEFNRAVSIASSYMALVDGGMAHEAALKSAHEISNKANGEYGPANLPNRFLGVFDMRDSNAGSQVARSWMMFKTFPMNALAIQFRDMLGRGLIDAGKGLKEGNLKALFNKRLQAFAHLTAGQILLAGPTAFGGAIAFEAAKKLLAAFGIGDDEDPEEAVYNWAEREYGEVAERVARHGLPSLVNVNLSGSMGMTNMFEASYREGWLGIAETLGGATASFAMDEGKAIVKLAQGEYAEAAEAAMPRIVSSPIRAMRELKEGIKKTNNQPVFDGEEQLRPTTGEALIRAAGFNPSRTSAVRDEGYAETEQSMRFSEERSALLARLRNILLRGQGEEEWRKLRADIEAYNERASQVENPEVLQLTESTLRRAISEMEPPDAKEAKELGKLEDIPESLRELLAEPKRRGRSGRGVDRAVDRSRRR